LTHKTMGYGVDSAVYLGQAHNLVTGRGPTVPMTFYTDHYTRRRIRLSRRGAAHPLYAALIALLEAVGLSAGAAVRWWSATLHALNLVLVLVAVMLSRVLTRKRWIGAIAGAVVLLTIGTWLSTHAFALSEALFLTWMLAALVILSRYRDVVTAPAVPRCIVCRGVRLCMGALRQARGRREPSAPCLPSARTVRGPAARRCQRVVRPP
jgi:hypothetical protein